MRSTLKNLISNNLLIKVIAFVFGYSLWALFNCAQLSTMQYDVPVSFFNTNQAMVLHAPETIRIELRGKRNALHSIDTKTLAVHLDASRFHEGANPVVLESESLFLPKNITMVHYTPSNLVIHAQATQAS